MNIKFSLIIAAYNVEKFINECLKSIQNQSYDNYEVIIVNDGSVDGTGNICAKYCEKDSRFKLFNQMNMGTSFARKKGVLESVGDYILIIDGDDYIASNTLEIVKEELSDDKLDVIQFGYIKLYHHIKLKTHIKLPVVESNERLEICLKDLFSGEVEFISNHLAHAVYRGSILREVVNKVNKRVVCGDDVYLNLLLFLNYKTLKIKFVDKQWYYYRQGVGLMSSADWNSIEKYSAIKTIQQEFIDVYALPKQYLYYIHIESMNMFEYYCTEFIRVHKDDIQIQNQIQKMYQYQFIQDAYAYFLDKKDMDERIQRFILKDWKIYKEHCKSIIASESLTSKITKVIKKYLREFL